MIYSMLIIFAVIGCTAAITYLLEEGEDDE